MQLIVHSEVRKPRFLNHQQCHLKLTYVDHENWWLEDYFPSLRGKNVSFREDIFQKDAGLIGPQVFEVKLEHREQPIPKRLQLQRLAGQRFFKKKRQDAGRSWLDLLMHFVFCTPTFEHKDNLDIKVIGFKHVLDFLSRNLGKWSNLTCAYVSIWVVQRPTSWVLEIFLLPSTATSTGHLGCFVRAKLLVLKMIIHWALSDLDTLKVLVLKMIDVSSTGRNHPFLIELISI